MCARADRHWVLVDAREPSLAVVPTPHDRTPLTSCVFARHLAKPRRAHTKRRIHLFPVREQPHLVERDGPPTRRRPPGSPHTTRPTRVDRQTGSPKLLAAMPLTSSAIPLGAVVSGRFGPAFGATNLARLLADPRGLRGGQPAAAPPRRGRPPRRRAHRQLRNDSVCRRRRLESRTRGVGVPVSVQGTGRQRRVRAARRRRPTAAAKRRRVTHVESDT